MRFLAAALLLALLLAGCSGTPTAVVGEDKELFADQEIHVSDTTGAIRGVVVDPSITPIPDAVVSIRVQASNRTATTDSVGRFSFSGLPPGSYFLLASKKLYTSSQTSVEVVAGVAEPDVVRLRLDPLFTQKPYTMQVEHKGFFQCSQAGAGLYSSSNCVTDQCPILFDPKTCNGLPTKAMDNITSQEREWHADIGAGWQQMVVEMTWEPTAQGTSSEMGMTLSTYKPERDPSHWFASVASHNPMRIQMDVGKEHETASGVEPTLIPAEGMSRMSFFASVRRDDTMPTCALTCGPAIAVNQDFQVFLTVFHFGLPKDGWSLVAGDPVPF